jgi:hypothetical protein
MFLDPGGKPQADNGHKLESGLRKAVYQRHHNGVT